MKITYDRDADALYIRLAPEAREVDTREIDADILADLDREGRLVGLEVLEASRRVDLPFLLWTRLREVLRQKQARGEPLLTPSRGVRNWIKEVGETYVVVVSEKTGKARTIDWREIGDPQVERHIGKRRIIYALRELGGYPDSLPRGTAQAAA